VGHCESILTFNLRTPGAQAYTVAGDSNLAQQRGLAFALGVYGIEKRDAKDMADYAVQCLEGCGFSLARPDRGTT
jgi:hypothetical protein